MGNFVCISTLKIWSFFALLLLSGCFAQGVRAEDYYWYELGTQLRDSSPTGLCGKLKPDGLIVDAVEVYGTTGRCVFMPPDRSFVNYKSISRAGSGCTLPAVYNAQTGECNAPPSACEPLAGQSVSFTLLRPDLGGLGPIEHACMNNCRIALGTTSCQPAYDGATGVCTGLGQYTGNDCQPSDDPTGGTPPTDPNPPTDPENPPPTCGDGYSWSGTTCVKDPPKECDPSTGEVCPPTDPENPGDGDGDGDGGDGGDGDGGDGGDGDGGDGGDGDGGNGDGGNGDGEGQCDPAKDPNKCGQSSVAGEACDASVTCSGDAIQCAILRQQKAQRCADEDWRKVDEKAVSDLETSIAANQSGESYQPIKATAEYTFSLDGMIDTSSRFSKSCPVIPDWSVPWIDGSNIAVSLSFLSDFCQYLAWMGYLLVAFAMRRAAEIIAGGMN